jgi:alkylation response protein AidB-like acyl-CoA dehydrogenase
VLSQEQQDLRETLRRFFAHSSPEAEVRRLMETEAGYDSGLWTRMADELGLQGFTIPEKFGGSGFGFVDLQVVLEEMGRVLLCAPFLSSAVLATQALLASGDEVACAEYLPAIAAGTSIATLAVTERSGFWSTTGMSTRAVPSDGGFRLEGTKFFVLDGHVADLLLVVAVSPAGPGLFAVRADAAGLERRPLTTLDLTRKQTELVFDGTPARLVGEDGAAAYAVDHAVQRTLAALAAEQVGGARRVLEMSVEYAKIRVQFGRPIGSFQAIKHKCADMLLEVESATSAAYAAGEAVDEGSDEAGLLASLAKAYCSDAYFRATAENIQVHGGIGFTWEHPAHLYLRRAKSSQLMFGAPSQHRELILQMLGV